MYYDLRKGGTLGNNPEWLKPHMDRTINMFERNKNYPSVTIWSLGNEAGNGYNFYQTYLWLKEADKNIMARPVNYERCLLYTSCFPFQLVEEVPAESFDIRMDIIITINEK